MPETKVTNIVNTMEPPAPAAEPVEPLAAAKVEVDAAIDDLLLGYSRVRVARLRDAIDQLRAAIPSRPPAKRGRRAKTDE